jgi:NADPH-dependent 2,4-dienoyl-CoA reductase/sulfur reductase-like enzyme
MPATHVIAAEPGRLLLEGPQRARWVAFDAVIMATGAQEMLLPFPGWSLPGVTGAGGLQALAKQGWPLAGRRVLVAGSGPLLLAAAATARRHGAHVLGIHEQAGRGAVAGFARGLWRWPAKGLQAAVLRMRLVGVSYHCGSVVMMAHGDEAGIREVELDGPRGRHRVVCDHLAVGYGLVPDGRLARRRGCRLQREGSHARVEVDNRQGTSVSGVYAAGEACGIGGRDCALTEGTIAGLAAAGDATPSTSLQRRRHHARAFAARLHGHFGLNSRIRALPQSDTLVCRCEDVPLQALEGHTDARAAKLATRCGMGPCQGRICGTALAELGFFPADAEFRPPLFPARLETLAEAAE